MIVRRKEAASLGPAAENIDQIGDYQKPGVMSRAELVEQAAEVLCLLLASHLSATTQMGFTALLERRLRRAYAGSQP